MAATVRLLAEIVIYPIAALSLFVWLVEAQIRMGREVWALLGACVFLALTAVILGVVAAACRQWAQGKGRMAFLLIVLLPWPLSELVLPAKSAALASIPGLLGLFLETLTRVPT
jgi:hypothetical protein